MAKAKVVLRGSQSYTTGGRTFRKGEPETISNISLIERLEAIPAFTVTRLDEPQRAPVHDGDTDEEPGGGDAAEDDLTETPSAREGLKAKRKKPRRG